MLQRVSGVERRREVCEWEAPEQMDHTSVTTSALRRKRFFHQNCVGSSIPDTCVCLMIRLRLRMSPELLRPYHVPPADIAFMQDGVRLTLDDAL